MGPPARQRPKAHIQKHAGMVEKEKMDCFKMASKKPARVQELEHYAKKQREKIPAEKCKKLIDS